MEYFKGIGKLTEEMGELNQLLGKAIAYPIGEHPDGKGQIYNRLPEELADVYAALDYFIETNYPLEYQTIIRDRTSIKHERFINWGLTGIKK